MDYELCETVGEKLEQAVSAKVWEATYTKFLINSRLNACLIGFNEQAQKTFFRLIKWLSEKEGITE